MEYQRNVNDVNYRFMQTASEYEAEIIITINSKNKKLRELIMNSIFLDHQNGTLDYEATPQDSDSLTFLRRILVKYSQTLNI